MEDLACVSTPLFGGNLGNWSKVKAIVVEVVTSTKDGIKELLRERDAVQDLIYDFEMQSQCQLGHLALRLAFLLLVSPADRVDALCNEVSPIGSGVGVVEVLTSGWPIFGLLSLLSYRTVKDGFVREVGHMSREKDLWECSENLESFRVRYWPATFENQDVVFSRDVEAHVLEYLDGDGDLPTRTNLSTYYKCLIGASLPLLGHAASLQCHARRDSYLHKFVTNMVKFAESDFLKPAESSSFFGARSPVARVCGLTALPTQSASLFSLLSSGFWGAEALLLLQRAAPAFATHGPRPPLGGPLPAAGSTTVVSLDPHEARFYGKGLFEFVSHVWGEDRVPGFSFVAGLPCADVLIVRDSLPSLPFAGALIYVDQEAGLGPGRDAGRMDAILERHRVVYLGVLEPLAETRCLSRVGSVNARARRVCTKVFSGRAALPSRAKLGETSAMLQIVHVPFASTSFASRRIHQPIDLAVDARAFIEKPKFLGYMAYACVEHREILFDLLVARSAQESLGAAEALSKCSGYQSAHRRVKRNLTRGNEASFLDEAVELLRPYRFALVFENKLVPGYVTEKIVNAFLAGCIPIYWGSRSVRDIFNTEAFIYANELQGAVEDTDNIDPLSSLDRVASEVARIATNPSELRKMATAPVLSRSQMQRYFSWHKSVPKLNADDVVGSSNALDLATRLSEAIGKIMTPRTRFSLCDGRLCSKEY